MKYKLMKTVNRVVELPVDAVRPNPAQPRREFAEKELEQLAVSIFGTSGNVEAITGDDILVTVDLADFGSAVGTYTVPAEVTVLGRDVGVSGGPYRVRVTISEQTADQPAEPDVPAGENPDTGDETT